jgi:hypothetical protein
MKVNMSIHTIRLNDRYYEHEISGQSVIPYLETNRLRPRLLAIQKTRPIPHRAKLLGRALLSVRTDANGFWMLLSGNAEVAFPSSTATIATAGSLTTAATAAAPCTSSANVAATALTTTATNSLLTAAAAPTDAAISAANPSTASASDVFPFAPTAATTAANVATPSADKKRKTCP